MPSSRVRFRPCLVWSSILVAVLGCAHRGPSVQLSASRPATAAEIVELKQAYAEYVMRLAEAEVEFSKRAWTVDELREAARQEGGGVSLPQYAIRRLTFHDDDATRAVLNHVMATSMSAVSRFYAACALAYQGRSDGLEMLQEVVIERSPLTASGFEISEGGMALAILGHELPPSFIGRPNALFAILDRLFE